MKELSKIALAVQPSATLAIDTMFKQMRADGLDVIGFGAGEPDFPTPDHIKEAGIQAIQNNDTKYTPSAGTVELRKAVCQRLKEDCGVDYEPSQISVSSGAKPCVYTALRALVDPGDEVILPAPYWVSYIELIRMVGGVPVVVEASEAEHFKITPEKLAGAKKELRILHPLPRVNEISTAIDEDPRACYFRQALCGKFVRMALILKLLEA